ncbi:carbon starvation protein A (plasmid) [Azospirillum baldaniorum]|uniref:Starvation-induced protein involved in peptide utilization during carbon starvation n=2 Tax=Azospirillum TaxID=191 RepID=A0A9P1JWW3_9PROT|nr:MULTISPECIES: carbon starvation protein A [Azospirillum]TWA81940.1 carbon starvation protein [Azospirillum brasilense]AIB15134.1 carbon starvation protein CstA [Azospirillum argentinense]AWJ94102.1 carbon starvation protein A [Azospirillum baldaniorum]EZQ03967.1 carbon starvation protein CstA [Azospirillum argentinense]NUB07701.1 carbon starvation protein A [Azospirillum baldaniorum]
MDHALTFVIATLCILALCYRFYGVFFVRKVLRADDSEVTPSHILADGRNYVPTKKWVNAGQHFAAIAAAGPLVGPVLAAQFGYLPSFLWLLIGCVIGGAVHDTVVLFASMKHKGQSLSEVAKAELGPVAGWCTGLAMLFIITITMAGLSMVVVHALERNAWGAFAVFMTIPIAVALGLYEKITGSSKGATQVGIAAIAASVFAGPYIQGTVLGSWLTLHAETVALILPIYAFFATALPVWMLLTPRGYLSSFMKIGVFGALVVGVVFINPEIRFPALTDFIHGGGPVLAGPVWPFISITIACGAISGFHAFIGSGTTPKLIDKWSDIRTVAFGGMLAECVVGVMALIAATSLHPADYFAINSSPAAFQALNMQVVDLPRLSQEIGLDLYGRTGGAVTLAVGMTEIFTRIPWFGTLASYFFQFVVMFEAVFILTAVDSGTRVARYLIQDLGGDLYAPLKRLDWVPGSIAASVLACVAWGYLLTSGDINSVWALFGVSNQLMASVGLIIGATIILRLGQKRVYMLTCLVPLAYLFVTVNYAGYWMITNVYLNPLAKGYNVFNAGISIIMLSLGFVILIAALKKWKELLRIRKDNMPETLIATPAE